MIRHRAAPMLAGLLVGTVVARLPIHQHFRPTAFEEDPCRPTISVSGS